MWLLFIGNIAAQKENNIWYFGRNLGLNFNTAPPTPLYNGKMQSFESSASVSDANGKLLFYTDGITVWNRLHGIMLNGTGLTGHQSSTQGALIVKKPGNSTLYYIFTADCNLSSTTGMHYSVVDITKNSGFGEVVQKNVPLLKTKGAEKLTAVKGYAGCGYWIITHGAYNDTFYSYHLTSNGIDTQAVISKTGYNYINDSATARGYLKANASGTKLVAAMYGVTTVSKRLELYDFDAATGIVSNSILVDSTENVYGVSFSPNQKLLYASSFPNKITQYDISSGDPQTITASKYTVVASLCGSLGAILKGPDNKLYITKVCQMGTNYNSYLDVIHNPDNYGPSCNYDANGLWLAGTAVYATYLNLPNNIESSEPFIPEFSLGPDNSFCADKSFTLGPDSSVKGHFLWSTGDSTKFITQNQPGLYWLKKTVNCISYTDEETDTIIVTAVNDTLPLNLGEDTLVCSIPYTLSAKNINGVSYSWSDGSVSPSVTANSPKTFYLKTTSVCGTKRDTINVTVFTDTLPPVLLGKDTVMCANSFGLSTDSVSQKQVHYLWNTGDTSTKITATTSGVYWVKVSNPCYIKGDTIQVQLLKDSVPQFSLGKDTLFCGSVHNLSAPIVSGAKYLWSTGDTTPNISVNTNGNYWAKAYTLCNTNADTVSISFYKDTTTLNIGNDTLVCGTLLKLTANTIPMGRYLWSTGDTTPSITVFDDDIYWAEVSTPCSLKNDSVSVQLVKTILSPADIGNDTSVCALQYRLTANYAGSGIKLLWSTGDTNDFIDITQTGMYWLQADNYCSVEGDTIFIELVQDSISSISLGNDSLVCKGSMDLDAGFVAQAKYLWNTGDTTQKITVEKEGIYKTEVTTYICNNIYSDSVTIEFFKPKPLVLQNDTLFCEHRFKGILLNGGDGYSTYLWNNGNTQPTLFANTDGLYTLTVTDTCRNTFTDDVVVNVCDCRLFVPTAFTPNGDGLNDVFNVTKYCGLVPYHIIIYNRWGEVVFETQNPEQGWDGTYSGVPAPEGVYGVNIRFGFTGALRTGDYMRNVTLLR